ncbi:glycosyltransferase family 4 protein [Candidatus Microgenomates bacterium]|nr:glycosyltransferase family 4 protein [Candidatus Microgenomates bacterium]
MKIAVLSFTSGKVSRGAETVVGELCKRWARKNEVRVFQMGEEKNKDINYTVRQIGSNSDWQAISRPVNNRLRRLLMVDKYHQVFFRLTREVIRKLDEWRPDIVIPINRGWQAVLIRLFCWFRGMKMVVLGLAGFKDRWSLITRPDIFITLTERNAKWARKHAFGVRVEMIPSGVDLKRFKPTGKELKIDLERPIVLCVAGSERYKHVEETIQAMSLLKNGSLLLVGGSKRQEKLGRGLLGKRFLQKKFTYKEMPMVYRLADVFTLVSEFSEAFGVSYLEALACGLPVVAPDDELRREILGKHGTYVQDVTNEKEYAKQLKKAIKQGKNRPEKWLAQFNWNRIAKQYEKLFKSL